MSGWPQLFERSVREFDSRVQQIKDDQWENATPCSEWNVRDLVNHLVYEDVWAPPLFEGKTVEEVGDKFEGDLLGNAPKEAWKAARNDALQAVNRPGAMEDTVHLSSRDVPGQQYLLELLTDHVIHAWDLARGIGADEQLDPELVNIIYENVAPRQEELKATGAYGDRVEAPEGADTQTKLLAIMGRYA